MTVLGSYQSDTGRVTLHHEAGVFTTRSTYTDAVDGVTRREMAVPHGRAEAWEWYDLCEREGAVLAPFPAELDKTADVLSGSKEADLDRMDKRP